MTAHTWTKHTDGHTCKHTHMHNCKNTHTNTKTSTHTFLSVSSPVYLIHTFPSYFSSSPILLFSSSNFFSPSLLCVKGRGLQKLLNSYKHSLILPLTLFIHNCPFTQLTNNFTRKTSVRILYAITSSHHQSDIQYCTLPLPMVVLLLPVTTGDFFTPSLKTCSMVVPPTGTSSPILLSFIRVKKGSCPLWVADPSTSQWSILGWFCHTGPELWPHELPGSKFRTFLKGVS